MSSTTIIGIWATGMWSNLGEPATISPLKISGYAVQPYTIGQLNTLIDSCFRATGLPTGNLPPYDVIPDLGYGQLAIIGLMYQVSFFNQMAIRSMGQGGDTLPWSQLKEADSTITRASAPNIGKEYREMSRVANDELNYLVNAYIMNSGQNARSVDFLNPGTFSNAPYGPVGGVFQG